MRTRQQDAVGALCHLVQIPSLSRQENDTATYIFNYLASKNITAHRTQNNVWAANRFYDAVKPTILLNSHHDTVAPNVAYTRDPYQAEIIDDKLYGLGSTDAGASLVGLMQAFVHFYSHENLQYNLVFAASAEEEISGKNGVELLFSTEEFAQQFHHNSSFAVVGEPTQLNLAIAEKGLMVLDCEATGRAGHAARDEGDNAIYKAVKAIEWFREFRFPKTSETLGDMRMTVTGIFTENKAHNVIPAACNFMVDVRLTDAYTHEEVLNIIRQNVDLQVTPRSTRLRPSSIAKDHPVVQAGMALGATTFGSPTTSDQALIPLPSLKCGPGFSGQSHSADEYVLVWDVQNGVQFYIELLEKLL